ncbi:MAG: GAF domain-containing protein [Chlorobi bacterium]|nr:GAF domain-containing protein [Chlorobiota bacterium]
MIQGSIDIIVFSDNSDFNSIFSGGISKVNTYIHLSEKDDAGFHKLGSHKFDLIIVDISQPLVSEIQFIEKLYSLNTSIPIVIVSEYFTETKDIVFGNKVSEFISKPLTAEKLYNTIHDTITTFHKSGRINEAATPENSEDKKKLSVLFEISKYLNSINNFDELLSTIIKLSQDAFDVERATLFVYDKKSNELWSKAGSGIKTKEIRFPVTSGIAGETALHRKSIITNNPYRHPSFNSGIDAKTGFITRNIISVPLLNLRGDVVGVFQLLNKRNNQFTPDDEIFLRAIGSTVAVSLENILLHEENRKRYEEIQELYDSLYTAQNMIVWETKHSLLSELRGYFSELKNFDSVNDSINDLKELVGNDVIKLGILDRIDGAHKKILSKIYGRLSEDLENLEIESLQNEIS